MEWQSIETAPKDGTRILAFRLGFIESKAVVWYSEANRDWIPVHGPCFPGVTHWMSLPDDPEC